MSSLCFPFVKELNLGLIRQFTQRVTMMIGDVDFQRSNPRHYAQKAGLLSQPPSCPTDALSIKVLSDDKQVGNLT